MRFFGGIMVAAAALVSSGCLRTETRHTLYLSPDGEVRWVVEEVLSIVSWVGAAEERFRYLPGSAEARWYESTPQGRRGFCGTCGTTLFYASSICPGEIHVARPAFPGAIDREPQCHIFFDQRVDWADPGDRLPRHLTDDHGLAKFKAVSR